MGDLYKMLFVIIAVFALVIGLTVHYENHPYQPRTLTPVEKSLVETTEQFEEVQAKVLILFTEVCYGETLQNWSNILYSEEGNL